MIEKLVSGGQTGVDRAGLDVALAIGIDCGGWCPKHRRAEDGRISSRYPLIEADSPNYAARTAMNVRDSDGTLILAPGELTGGTALTRDIAQRYGRPLWVVDLDQDRDFEAVERWLTNNRIRTLNVAGPRESQQPGIHDRAVEYLQSLLQREKGDALSAPKPRRKAAKKKLQ